MKIKQSISVPIKLFSAIAVIASMNLFSQQVLKPQEAFPIEIFMQNNVIQINHRIEDGYYLYKIKSATNQSKRVLFYLTILFLEASNMRMNFLERLKFIDLHSVFTLTSLKAQSLLL